MDDEFKTLDVSGSEHDRMMAEKDAEIERLKEEKQHAGVECIAYIGELAEEKIEIERLKRFVSDGLVAISNKDKLITELADAIVMESPAFDVDYSNLIKRAREATKE